MPTRLIALLFVLLLAGCQLTQTGDPTPSPTLIAARSATPAPASPTPETTPEATLIAAALPTATPSVLPTVPPVPARDVLMGGVLAWIGTTGGVAGTPRTGQVALITADGTISTLIDAPNIATPARACGERPAAGDLFAFFVGGERGTLYIMRGANAPVAIAETDYLACLGMGTFAWSPNAGRFAFIDYPAGATRAEYTAGTLRAYASTDFAPIAAVPDVSAFALGLNDALLLRFYPSARGIAEEAAVLLWEDGADAPREIATLLPTEGGCRFTSGQIVRADGDALLIMGQRCTRGDTATRWQLYTVGLGDGAASLVRSDAQPGAFVTFARNNALFPSPDGRTVYFSVPDGVAAFTVALAAINRADFTISVPVARQAVFPNYSGTTNAAPRFSPDGRWLGFVITSPDADNQIAALELNAPARPPVTVSAGGRGNLIPGFAFSPFSDRLYAIAGGADNALLDIDLNSGASRRIARGRFSGAVVANRDQIAVLDGRRESNPPGEFLDLVLVSIADGSKRTIFRAEALVGGASRIAVPLAWR